MRQFLPLLFAALLVATPLVAAERHFTILHSNDWQSRLLGFGPNNEYSPATINDDDTVGGIARLATLLNERRAAPVKNRCCCSTAATSPWARCFIPSPARWAANCA